MIVVDTNILAYLYTNNEFTDRANHLLTLDENWAAPILWRSEFRNLLTGFIRRKQFTAEHALVIQHHAESLLTANEHIVESEAVFRLVRQSQCSAYDCEFVALAQSLGTSLYTMDGKILREFPQTALPLPTID